MTDSAQWETLGKRLAWRYPEDWSSRLSSYVDGSNTDLLAWRKIGGRMYFGSDLDLARRLVFQGCAIEEASEMTGIGLRALRASVSLRPV